MTKVKRVLRGGTRNQSTADYQRFNLFPYRNRYYNNATVYNSEAAPVTIEEGVLLMRDAGDASRVKPIVLTADLAKCIGIVSIAGEVVLAQTESTTAALAVSGDIDGELLVLPEVSTLATIVGDRTLKDLLTSLGFHVLNVTENSKFDN